VLPGDCFCNLAFLDTLGVGSDLALFGKLPEAVGNRSATSFLLKTSSGKQKQEVNDLTREVNELTEEDNESTREVSELTRKVDESTRTVDELSNEVNASTRKVEKRTSTGDGSTEAAGNLTTLMSCPAAARLYLDPAALKRGASVAATARQRASLLNFIQFGQGVFELLNIASK